MLLNSLIQLCELLLLACYPHYLYFYNPTHSMFCPSSSWLHHTSIFHQAAYSLTANLPFWQFYRYVEFNIMQFSASSSMFPPNFNLDRGYMRYSDTRHLCRCAGCLKDRFTIFQFCLKTTASTYMNIKIHSVTTLPVLTDE